MNIKPVKPIPNLPENPWLTRGTAHILKSGRSAPPPTISQVSQQKSTYKEYSLCSEVFTPTSSLQSCLSSISEYISSLLDNDIRDSIYTTDFSVFDNTSFVGLKNEGNNCYQNCIIQV